MTKGDTVYYKSDKISYGKYCPEFIILREFENIFEGMTIGGRFKRFESGNEQDWIKSRSGDNR